jgi:hypothetical protein
MPTPRYVVLANPDSKRWQGYRPDLEAFWQERGVRPEVVVVPWSDIIPRDGNLDGLRAFDEPALVRMESPGRDWLVSQLLLAAGSRATGQDADIDWLSLPYRKGYLIRPGLLYAGFRRVLQGLRASFDARPHLRPLACPLAVAELFDKNATQRQLVEADIPCPPSLEAPDTPGELLEALRARRFVPGYVKLNTGSSASAIAVVRPDAPARAVTSIVRLPDGFASTRRLKEYRGADLDAVLAFLLKEGVCVQQGIRMAQIDGHNFDVRVVVLHGRPAFTVFRLSTQPMTNLHLGGRRGDPGRCRQAIPTRAWLDALDHCVEAARLYRASAVGVDLLFEAGYLRHYILEVNAFGDFFPGLTDAEGRTVHRAEIEASARAHGLL